MTVIKNTYKGYSIRLGDTTILYISANYYRKTISYLLEHSVNHIGYIIIPSLTRLNELALLVLLEDPRLCQGLMEFMIVIKALNRPNQTLTLHLIHT